MPSSKKPNESLGSMNAYYADSPKYFAKDVSLEAIQSLWEGLPCNDVVVNHLFKLLLTEYSFNNNLAAIDVPVIVAGGHKDYDSIPLTIWPIHPKPARFTLLDCGDVGHWPHWEAPELFDPGVGQWFSANLR